MALTQEQTNLIDHHVRERMVEVKRFFTPHALMFGLKRERTIYLNTYEYILTDVIENADNRYSDEMKGAVVDTFQVAVRDAAKNAMIKYLSLQEEGKSYALRPATYHHDMALRLLQNYWELYQAIVEKNEPEKFLNNFKQSYQQLLIDYKDRDAFYKHSEKLLDKIQHTIQQSSANIEQLRQLQTYLDPINHGINFNNKVDNITRPITTLVSDMLNANIDDGYEFDVSDEINRVIEKIKNFKKHEHAAVLDILREQLLRLPKNSFNDLSAREIEFGEMSFNFYDVLSLINETDEQVFQSAFQAFTTSFAKAPRLGFYEKQAIDLAQKDNSNNHHILKIIAFLAEPPLKPSIKTQQTEPNVSKETRTAPPASESRSWYGRFFASFFSITPVEPPANTSPSPR